MSSYSDYRNALRRARAVSTSAPSCFDDGEGHYFVMSPQVRRTFGDHEHAITHATNLIRNENCDEFLIVKVVGRVRKKPIPVEYVNLDDSIWESSDCSDG